LSTATLADGRYRLERELGRGAMATVFLARDEELGRPVAVKLLEESAAADESLRRRFTREAQLAAGLSHPNVVQVFDVGEADGRPFIVMECVEGPTLAERLAAEGPLPPPEVAAIGRQVCAGLERAHAAGLVHRDLKPGNLIQGRDGTVKIADFGIAYAAEATSLTEAGTILGTASYLAPEQAEGEAVTEASDIYALGAVLYELLSGRPPYAFESLADVATRSRLSSPPPLPGIAAHLEGVVLLCLEPNPADRPGSAAELRRALELDEAVRPDERATVVMRPGRRRAGRTSARSWVTPLLLLGALVALGVGLGLATLGGGDEPPPAQTEGVPRLDTGGPPAQDARNLADWLRENAR
jgi:eukaryotic-like serine/threonine-protein kinase